MNDFNGRLIALLSLFVSSACSGTIQPLGDAASGASAATAYGGSTNTAGSTSAAGNTSADGRVSTGGSTSASGICSVSCSDGSECFPSLDGSHGVCTPLCDSQEQSDWGRPCANSVSEGAGVCRPFLKNRDGHLEPTGVCTRGCDPLAQDCPGQFGCDLAEIEAGTMPGWTFGCLPIVEAPPKALGDECHGTAMGNCLPGLTCVPEGSTYRCREFCDLSAPTSCSGAQICIKLDYFPAASAIGVCQD